MSARMVGRSERRRSAKWEARCVVGGSSVSVGGSEVAVVSQRPGSCGVVGVGRVEVEVGMGIWRERERVGVRFMWAMREWEMLV